MPTYCNPSLFALGVVVALHIELRPHVNSVELFVQHQHEGAPRDHCEASHYPNLTLGEAADVLDAEMWVVTNQYRATQRAALRSVGGRRAADPGQP